MLTCLWITLPTSASADVILLVRIFNRSASWLTTFVLHRDLGGAVKRSSGIAYSDQWQPLSTPQISKEEFLALITQIDLHRFTSLHPFPYIWILRAFRLGRKQSSHFEYHTLFFNFLKLHHVWFSNIFVSEMAASPLSSNGLPDALLKLSQLAKPTSYADVVAFGLIALGSAGYLLRGIVWDKPDPYHHVWFERPQEKDAASRNAKKETRNIAQKPEDLVCLVLSFPCCISI